VHIYIDESGIFSNPANRQNVASCVAALVIPSSRKVQLLRDFENVSIGWPNENGEIKGRLLDEDHIGRVVALLQKYDVLLEITAIDLGVHTDQEITKFKTDIADIVSAWVGPQHPLKTRTLEIAEAYRQTSNQLFVEFHLLLTLIPRLIQNAITYYARRTPKELKSFHWVIDAKDTAVTAFERAWSDLLFPSVAYQTQLKPWVEIEGGDYSYFEDLFHFDETVISRLEQGSRLPREEIAPVALQKLLGKSFKFEDSKAKLGLQLADILANAMQRAFNGRLSEEGWKQVGSLMVTRDEQLIRFVLLEARPGVEGAPRRIKSPFAHVIDKLSTVAKPMFLNPEEEAYLLRRSRACKRRSMKKHS
jgi:uncharacterized protein DUF3800